MKEKGKEKYSNQRSEERKREIYRKVVGPDNVWIMYRFVTSKKEKKRRRRKNKVFILTGYKGLFGAKRRMEGGEIVSEFFHL